MSDLLERMEEARRALTLAQNSDLFADNAMARIVLQGIKNQIGAWQSEVIGLELDLKRANRRIANAIAATAREEKEYRAMFKAHDGVFYDGYSTIAAVLKGDE
jgi:hypothetical protein